MFRSCTSRTAFVQLAASMVCARTAASAGALAQPALRTNANAASVLIAGRRTFTSEAAESLEQQIQDTVSSNKVVVYSKTTCPFCAKTKELFSDMGVDATVIELNKRPDGPELQQALQDFSGQRTVPNVFVNGEHLGGNDDTQTAAKSGKLRELLGMA